MITGTSHIYAADTTDRYRAFCYREQDAGQPTCKQCCTCRNVQKQPTSAAEATHHLAGDASRQGTHTTTRRSQLLYTTRWWYSDGLLAHRHHCLHYDCCSCYCQLHRWGHRCWTSWTCKALTIDKLCDLSDQQTTTAAVISDSAADTTAVAAAAADRASAAHTAKQVPSYSSIQGSPGSATSSAACCSAASSAVAPLLWGPSL